MKKFFEWLSENPVVPTLVILAGAWFAYSWWTRTPPPPQRVVEDEERRVARPAEAPPAVVMPPQRALDPFTPEGMITTAERSVESSSQLSYHNGWRDGQRSIGVRHLNEEQVLDIARRVVERERQRLREAAPPPSEEVPRPTGQLIDPGAGTMRLPREERYQVFYQQ